MRIGCKHNILKPWYTFESAHLCQPQSALVSRKAGYDFLLDEFVERAELHAERNEVGVGERCFLVDTDLGLEEELREGMSM
jgi:hypothetical protein